MGIPEIKRGSRTLSQQITDWLAGRIMAGEFEPEVDPVPSEQQLMRMFGVSRVTARKVHEKLRQQGLVHTVPHVGTFVVAGRPQNFRYPPAGKKVSGKRGRSDVSRRGDLPAA